MNDFGPQKQPSSVAKIEAERKHRCATDVECVDEYDYECQRCQGSGEVTTADYESYFGQNYKPCPMCGGNGNR